MFLLGHTLPASLVLPAACLVGSLNVVFGTISVFEIFYASIGAVQLRKPCCRKTKITVRLQPWRRSLVVYCNTNRN